MSDGPQDYDGGGVLQPGVTLTTNTTGKPEPVVGPGPEVGGVS